MIMSGYCRVFSVQTLWRQALLIIAALSVGSGCATDELPPEAESCVVASDCAGEQICGPKQVCIAQPGQDDDAGGNDAQNAACEVSECSEIPEPACNGAQLLTFDAACEAGACSYPVASTLSCDFGCADGACKPDPCAAMACDAPPSNRCEDFETLVVYEAGGVCTAGECSYSSTATTCVHGCSNGACNQGACDQAVCESPPAPQCIDHVGRVYAPTGQCVEEDGSASCHYELTFNHCDYVGGDCEPSTGTCINAVTEVGGAAVVEFMANPGGISDARAEWFELFNTGASLDLNGWTLRSGTSGQTVEEHLIEGAPTMAAGERFVFAIGADPAGDGSVTPDYLYDGITLSNSTDWLELINAGGEVVDRVFWEAGSVMDGKSRKVDPDRVNSSNAARDNNRFENWCPELDAGFGAHDNFGSPGSANPACSADACAPVDCENPADFCADEYHAIQYAGQSVQCEVSRFRNPFCDFTPVEVECDADQYCINGACESVAGRLPAPGEIVFTEFMGNPSIPGVSDTDSEFVEIYNTTDEVLTLFTLVMEDNEAGASHDQFVVQEPLATIAAHGYAVFVANTNPNINGGIAQGYELADSPLKNSPGTAGLVISLKLQNGTLIDQAHYAEPISGVSQQLSLDVYSGGATNVAQANDSAADFCSATRATPDYAGSGQLGSPGAANEICP
jgi:hypothetical protein